MDNSRVLFCERYDGKCRDQFCLYEQGLWPETYDRWFTEGLPRDLPVNLFKDVDEAIVEQDLEVYEYMNILWPCYLPVTYQPIPSQFAVLEIDPASNTQVVLDAWGTKMKIRIKGESLPQYLEWPIKNISDWEAYNDLFQGPVQERLPRNWDELAKKIRSQTHGIVTLHTIGMFAFPREVMGLEPMLLAFFDNPELIERMLDDRLEFYFRTYKKPVADTKPDIAFIWEDMSYIHGPLLSPDLVRKYLLPRYKKLCNFFKDMGCHRIVVDSDGDVSKLIPIWREAGVNGIMPFETKAGNNVEELTAQWPDMVFIGGIDKHEIAKGKEAIDQELKRRLTKNIDRSNYIPSLDHWIPPDISYVDYCYYRDSVLNFHQKHKN
jgi:uroporphyrinogen decarboxylase